MKQKSRKYFGFTILEMLTVTVILWIIIPSIITIYSFMIKSNKEFNLRQTAIQQWYEFFEKLNILMQDYTIDYEEYYNRQMVWCVNSGGLLTWGNFKWNIWLSGYCTQFTAYWNENSTDRRTRNSGKLTGVYHDIYNCSSMITSNNQGDIRWLPRTVMGGNCWKIWSKQSFGQFKNLFIDVNAVTGSMDDRDLWKPVSNITGAIIDSDNIQELYLISHDWKNRLYFRRKLVAQSSGSAQYKIQILRLRWFDAWQNHNYDVSSEWIYDGQIDTWACDTSMWFSWHWQSVWWAYSSYHLPSGIDDCWVDLTYWGTSVYTWNISISPLNDPDLYWADQSRQINPYMKILVVNGVYLPTANSGSSITEFRIPIETAINMKDFYKE